MLEHCCNWEDTRTLTFITQSAIDIFHHTFIAGQGTIFTIGNAYGGIDHGTGLQALGCSNIQIVQFHKQSFQIFHKFSTAPVHDSGHVSYSENKI